MKRVALAAAAAIFVLSGCSNASDEQSDKGPSTTAAGGSTTSTSLKSSSKGATPSTSAALYVSGNPTIGPGEPGKLSVVSVGTQGSNGSVPVVFRNNTGDVLTDLELSGTARGADGSLIGSGEDQGIEPFVANPGEWAFGYVFFDTTLPSDAKIEVTARGDKAEGKVNLFDRIPLKVAEVNLVKEEFGNKYIGIVANTSDEKALDQGAIMIACFDASSQPIAVFSGYTDGEVSKGGTASFSVDTYSDQAECASYAVGASGYES